MEDKNVLVAIIGEDPDTKDVLYRGLKEFPIQKIILITEEKHEKKAQSIQKDLEKFKIPVEFEYIQNRSSLEEVFGKIRKIKEQEQESKIIINVDTDNLSSCLALSSAFVNGIQAIGILHDDIIAYPIMKFSYYNTLSDKKLNMLKLIYNKGTYPSLDSLSKEINMSLPLIIYHIKGSRDKMGLQEMGLVQTKRNRGNIEVTLTSLGRLITKGHIDFEKVK